MIWKNTNLWFKSREFSVRVQILFDDFTFFVARFMGYCWLIMTRVIRVSTDLTWNNYDDNSNTSFNLHAFLRMSPFLHLYMFYLLIYFILFYFYLLQTKRRYPTWSVYNDYTGSSLTRLYQFCMLRRLWQLLHEILRARYMTTTSTALARGPTCPCVTTTSTALTWGSTGSVCYDDVDSAYTRFYWLDIWRRRRQL